MNNLNHSRTLAARLFVAVLVLAGAGSALATVRYVDVNGTNATPPFTSWSTAATNIQDAVDAAMAGDEIVVTNGIYVTGGRVVSGTTNRVAVDKPLNVRSVNGAQFTTIDGSSSNRCAYLTNGASLTGFTLTHGRAGSGGGLWCESTNAVASNCVVSGNSTFWENHPVIVTPCCRDNASPASAGGAYGGTLNNCILSNNWVETYSYSWFDCDGSTCNYVSVGSRDYYFPGSGGGAYGCTLNNCALTGNSAGYGGGAYGCTLNNCTLAGNSGGYGGGAYGCTLNNCTLNDNSATSGSSQGGGAFGCTLNNCTVAGNRAYASSYSDGDYYYYGSGGGAFSSTLNNCILYFNTAPDGANYYYSTLNNSCTTPLPTNGVGNITNAPLFVNTNGWSNLRLQSGSPGINAGSNAFAPAGPDLDSNPRIVGTVDMGAYEFQLITLINAVKLPGGAFQFAFAGTPFGEYTVLATTNVAFLLPSWTVLGVATEFAPGWFVFSDPQAVNSPKRFYRVVRGLYSQGELLCLYYGGPKPLSCFECSAATHQWVSYAQCGWWD